jgi:serine/threonine protein phosphatase 1
LRHMTMHHRVSLDRTLPEYPPSPEGSTIYAIGDIHGRADLLDQIHRLIDADTTTSKAAQKVEIYLGDYIDRGADSAAVVSRLINRAGQTSAIFLRGNHEQLLLDFLDGKDCWPEWKTIGGATFCLSYGIRPDLLDRYVPSDEIRQALFEALPADHLRFYADTGSYCSAGAYLFVHAGIRPGIRLKDQLSKDLMGIRGSFLKYRGDFGYIVVHGHTTVKAPDLRENRINIDTGAFATNRLTCLRIDCDGISVLTP